MRTPSLMVFLLGLTSLAPGCSGRTPGGNGGCLRDEECASSDPCLRGVCEDQRCRLEPAPLPDIQEVCTDGQDNDCDGLTDCDDPGCAIDPTCCSPQSELCDDEVDNDCDGLTDCDDPDCEGELVCCVPVYEYCGDGIDNDCDGLTDCSDPDCGGAVACGAPACYSWEGNYAAMACGDSLNTSSRFMQVSRYSCGGPEELAAELPHKFANLTDDHRLVQVAVQIVLGRLDRDIFVLEGELLDGQTTQVCDPGRCIAKAANPGLQDEWVAFVAEPNRLYFLVVDGPSESFGGGWLINIFCSDHCVPEECGDGLDNDCDGLVDCDDSDCIGAPACVATGGG